MDVKEGESHLAHSIGLRQGSICAKLKLMEQVKMPFIGIEVSVSRPHFTYAALSQDRKILTIGGGQIADVLAFVRSQPSAFLAINAPKHVIFNSVSPNTTQPTLLLPSDVVQPDAGRAEAELRSAGFKVKGSPTDSNKTPRWMQRGFMLYEQLSTIGYHSYHMSEEPCQWIQIHAESCFSSLLKREPFPASSVEGRIQRQLLLYENRLPVKDPMEFFEEVTGYKLLQGILPLQNIHTAAELNALVAAATAWLFINKPDFIRPFGDVKEGQIFLPLSGFPR